MEASIESLKKRVEELLKIQSPNSFGDIFLQNVLDKLNDENHTLHIAEGVNSDKIYKYCQDVIEKYFNGVNKFFGYRSNSSFFPGKTISINIYIVSYILNITNNVDEIITKMGTMKYKELNKKHRKLSLIGCAIRNYDWSSLDALLSLGDENINNFLDTYTKDYDITKTWFYLKDNEHYVSFDKLQYSEFNSIFSVNNPLYADNKNPVERPPKEITIKGNIIVTLYSL